MSDPNASTHTASPNDSSSKSKIESMPYEILVQIWIHLDEAGARALSQTCWELQEASGNHDLRARWLLAEYGPAYALFHGIARPMLFNVEFCNVLIAYGAAVSFALTQELARERKELKSQDKWGMTISWAAAMAVMTEGAKRYSHFEINGGYSEMRLFLCWLQNSSDMTPDELKEMFIERQFVPLPLKIDYDLPESNLSVEESQVNMCEKIGIVIQYLHDQLRYNATQTKTPKRAADTDI